MLQLCVANTVRECSVSLKFLLEFEVTEILILGLEKLICIKSKIQASAMTIVITLGMFLFAPHCVVFRLSFFGTLHLL